MDEETRKLIQHLTQVTEDNNKMLHRMRREVLFARYIHVFYWLVILGVTIWSYYYLKPYIDQITAVMSKVSQIQNFGFPK